MLRMPTLLKTPRLISIVRFDANQPLNIAPGHSHEETEFLFVEEGSFKISINDDFLSVSAGDIVLLNANVPHSVADKTPTVYSVLFSDIELSGLPAGNLIPDTEHPILDARSDYFYYLRYLEDAAREFAQEPVKDNGAAAFLLTAMLLKIIRAKFNDQPVQNLSIAERTKRYIEQNYHIELSLNDLANQFFVSPYHLSHTFKDEVGISPIQYLIQHRIKVAQNLLQNTDLPVSEIASKVGYPNANYFNLIFKKIVGTSPGKYRKQNK